MSARARSVRVTEMPCAPIHLVARERIRGQRAELARLLTPETVRELEQAETSAVLVSLEGPPVIDCVIGWTTETGNEKGTW